MKRYAAVFIVFVVILSAMFPFFRGKALKNVSSAPETDNVFASLPFVNAKAFALTDMEGNLYFAENADKKFGMASTTKIMTCLVAIENGDLEKEISVPRDCVGIEGSSVYLKEGEIISLRELLYCLMLESGNDAAEAIAFAVSGGESEFVGLMNSRAAELGLKNTKFANPHGLSAEGHYTTAHDLAIITAEAFKYPLFREIVATRIKKVRYNGTENGRTLINHNKLIFSQKDCIGVKTGYTKADGKCLVSAFEHEGTGIICVSLGDPYPSGTHKAAAEKFYSVYKKITVAKANTLIKDIKIIGGEREYVKAANPQDAEIIIKNGESFSVEYEINPVNAPVEYGDIIGYAKVTVSGKTVYIINLEATEDVKVKKYNFFEKLFGKTKTPEEDN